MRPSPGPIVGRKCAGEHLVWLARLYAGRDETESRAPAGRTTFPFALPACSENGSLRSRPIASTTTAWPAQYASPNRSPAFAPENPEYLSELGSQSYKPVEAYYPSTGEMDPGARAEAAALAIDAARGAGFVAAGFTDVRAGADTVATSNGLFAHHRRTGVASTMTVRTPDGSSSGWAGDEAADWTQIGSERIAEDAVRKCAEWRGKTALEPGEYEAVLEPTAVGMLMLRMRGAFSARQADEGRSFFSKPGGGHRVCEKLFDEKITLRSDPAAADWETAPFTGDGQPVTEATWVENGVLKNLAYSRFWAERQGVEPRPGPTNLVMGGR